MKDDDAPTYKNDKKLFSFSNSSFNNCTSTEDIKM